MTEMFRPHSTIIGHESKCRCKQCMAATNFNKSARSLGYKRTVERDRIIDHIEYLQKETGLSLLRIGQAAGINVRVIHYFTQQPNRRMFKSNADKIMALTPAIVEAGGKHPRAHYQWRMGVLQAQGYSVKRIEEVAGGRVKLTVDARYNLAYVSPELWDRLDGAWRVLSKRMATPELDGILPGHIAGSRTTAAKNGYYPLAAYDNEFDPEPADTKLAYEMIRNDFEAVADLVERRVRLGWDRSEIKADLASTFPDVRGWDSIVSRVQKRIARSRAA